MMSLAKEVQSSPSSLQTGPLRDVRRIDSDDNVAVALRPLSRGDVVLVDDLRLELQDEVVAGHKISLTALEPGERVIKYGFPIGVVTEPVRAGAWVHSHNLHTLLEASESPVYRYAPAHREEPAAGDMPTWEGYRRGDGRVGTRNELWILSTVGCVNHAAERIARGMTDRLGGAGEQAVDGVFAFPHQFGCSQLGDDLENTRKLLAGLLRHPNAGGVLVIGLGCENNQMDALLQLAGDVDRDRLRFFNSQDVIDELEAGNAATAELLARMADDRRETCPASDLLLGHKCGGSDGFSGITANPLLGRVADRLTALGGGVLLTEVPEMFGAEQMLLERAADAEVFADLVAMINDFKQYFARNGQPIYENPSPGNKAGGLTTLEEKSLGAIQKGGRQATVRRVLRYGARASVDGLSLLESPGNDGVSSTAMVASGATILLFTTGRGTPLGFPAPTIKIASNREIAQKKPHWIDFDAGRMLDGSATMDGLTDELFALVLEVASGRQTNNERHGYREIAIWKGGVTL